MKKRTPEEIREINRKNAQKSTGPRTAAGKAKSRHNSMKHGMRAAQLAMACEDPKVVADRTEAWNDYYKPASPAAQHLINACVHATLLTDRCHRYHDEMIARQVRGAVRKFDARQDERAERHIAMLDDDPARAVRKLKRDATAAHYLLERWTELAGVLRTEGFWPDDEFAEAVKLRGLKWEDDTLRLCPDVWILLFMNTLCETKTVDDPRIDYLVAHVRIPEKWSYEFGGKRPLPKAEEARAYLEAIVAEEIAELSAEAGRLEREIEAPDRAEAPARSLILLNDRQARNFLRYHGESRLAFSRSYADLVKALDRDAAGPEEVAEAIVEPPNEPVFDAVDAEAAGCDSVAEECPDLPTEPSPAPEIEGKVESPNEPVFEADDAEDTGCDSVAEECPDLPTEPSPAPEIEGKVESPNEPVSEPFDGWAPPATPSEESDAPSTSERATTDEAARPTLPVFPGEAGGCSKEHPLSEPSEKTPLNPALEGEGLVMSAPVEARPVPPVIPSPVPSRPAGSDPQGKDESPNEPVSNPSPIPADPPGSRPRPLDRPKNPGWGSPLWEEVIRKGNAERERAGSPHSGSGP